MTDPELRAVLSERIANVRARINAACGFARAVKLVAVTKTVSARVAAIAFELGLTDLGESRPQALWQKAAALPGATWHMIGHLQRNKLERTVPLVSLIHSVDSERLLHALDAFGRARGVPVPVLLEVNCSGEAAKGGFAPDAVPVAPLPGVQVRGLMTMAALEGDPRPAFARLRELRDALVPGGELSMGMSNDFEVAVEEGATLVRLGTTLFEGLSASGAA